MYYTGKEAFKAYAKQVEENPDIPMQRGVARTMNRTFSDYDGSLSIRGEYHRGDYEWFRISETIPKEPQKIIQLCMEAYKKVGTIRNIIDTMSDFGSQGIRLQHEDERLQEFYDKWWEKVNGMERSERFLNYLYRSGQAIVKKAYGFIPVGTEKNWKKGVGELSVKIDPIEPTPRYIPLQYTFLNPVAVEILGDEAAVFVGKPNLALRLSSTFVNHVKSRNILSTYNDDLMNRIPSEVKDSIKNIKDTLLPLDPTKVDIYYYKKDDWSLWAMPIAYAVMNDLFMLEKMKLADLSALDGAISNIRLWTIGVLTDDPNTTILPTRAMINKVRNVLANVGSGGVIDMVWGPELKFTESNSQVWRFLGSEKYTAVLNAIYEGMGVPPSLRTSGGGNSNGNFAGLNTMVKRLQYGRSALSSMWQKELAYVHKAMGFEGKPPVVVYDYMVLSDEAAEKQLLIHLWDRDIIPTETILEIFGRIPRVEEVRTRREWEKRGSSMPEKASPYHAPEKEHEYKKILLQGGQVAPSEVGMKLNEKKTGEKTRLEMAEESQLKLKKVESKKVPGVAGRPNNVTETSKRKPKPKEKPSAKAFVSNLVWSISAYQQISDKVNPALLKAVGKANLRQLTNEESQSFERVKFNILSHFDIGEEITESKIAEILSIDKSIDNRLQDKFVKLKASFIEKYKREPKMDELRNLYASSYAAFKAKK